MSRSTRARRFAAVALAVFLGGMVYVGMFAFIDGFPVKAAVAGVAVVAVVLAALLVFDSGR